MKPKLFAAVYLAVAISITAPVAITGVFTGCTTSQQRVSYNTLATIGQGVDASYKSYLDLVIAGQVKTNSVPAVSRQYNEFQRAFGAAIVLVQLNSNAPAPSVVLDAAAKFATAVDAAKKGK